MNDCLGHDYHEALTAVAEGLGIVTTRSQREKQVIVARFPSSARISIDRLMLGSHDAIPGPGSEQCPPHEYVGRLKSGR